MTLLNRVVREKRTLILVLVFILVGNVLAYAALVRPRGVRAGGAADRAAAAARDRAAAERAQAQAQALVNGKVRADEALDAFYGRVLPASREAARRMLDTTLPALAEDADVQWIRRTSTIADVGDDATLGQVTINMVLQGEYGALRDFLYAVESAPHFILVDDVALAEGQSDEPLTLTVRMSTFFRKPHGA